MAISKNYIQWNIEESDLISSTIGYQVDWSEKRYVPKSSITASYNTYDNTGEFSWDAAGDGTFVAFPSSGITPVVGHAVRCSIEKERTLKPLVFVAGNTINRVSSDGRTLINSVVIPALSASCMGVNPLTNDLWLGTGATSVTAYSSNGFFVVGNIDTSTPYIQIVFDGTRGAFWHISASSVALKRISDGSTVQTFNPLASIVSVTSSYVGKRNGDLYLGIVNSMSAEVFMHFNRNTGLVFEYPVVASSISQFGSNGVLIASNSHDLSYYNNTGSPTIQYTLADMPGQIVSSSSCQYLYFFDSTNNVLGKYDRTGNVETWSHNSISTSYPGELRIRVDLGDPEYGRQITFWSRDVFGAIRDFGSQYLLIQQEPMTNSSPVLGEVLSWIPSRSLFSTHYPVTSTNHNILVLAG